MLNQKRIQDAYYLMQRFSNTMKFTNDKNGLIWYHALCLDMLLDTSLTITPYEACYQFYLSEITTLWVDGHPEARARFFANLLLWNVRHEVYEMAHVWAGKLETCFSIEAESSFNNTFTGLRIMEALTIQLSHALVDRDLTLFEHYDREMQQIIKWMEAATRNCNCFADRFHLQRIHFELVKKFDEKLLSKLDKLMNMAHKNKNHCAYDMIMHHKRAWRNELRTDVHNFWTNHSTIGSQIELGKLASTTDRIFPFSLPIK